MNKIDILNSKFFPTDGLTFDDILLLPNYSEILREDVDLLTELHPKIKLKLPVISSPMDTVTETDMAIAMAQAGGLGVIHRNLSIDSQADIIRQVKSTPVANPEIAALDTNDKLLVAAGVGIGSDMNDRVRALIVAKTDLIAVDSAHGHTKGIIDAIRTIKSNHPEVVLMAGNVASFDGAKALIEAGADIIRVGMGPGSICTTRIISGMGVPQITAVMEAVKASTDSNATIVADGGIRQMGDMAKALAVGANAVMLGSLLAGYDQSPGDTIEFENQKFKQFRGMGSASAMAEGGAARYAQSDTTTKSKLISEGVEGLVPYKGNVEDYLHQIEGSLRSSFFYLGSPDLTTFFQTSKIIKISAAGMIESHPHDIQVTDAGSNYSK